jgi:hypothetical protein
MLTNPLSRKRKNTVKNLLTTAPADWLLAQYEAARELALDHCESVAVQPLYMLKSMLESGEPMRVTASDYGDTDRWWL